jgi:hypothetical protein
MMRRIALCAVVVAVLTSQPALAGGIGRIKTVAGIASVLRGGTSLPVKPGFILEQGDKLITGKGGKLGVTMNDDTRIAAGANSAMSIPEFSFDDTTHAGKFLSRIEKGKVAIVSGHIAKSAKDAMKVQTPSALLGVRGTRFVVDVN